MSPDTDPGTSRRRDREREIRLAAAAAVPPFTVCVEIVNGLAIGLADRLIPPSSTHESRALLIERLAFALHATADHILQTLDVDRRAEAGDPVAQARVNESRLRTARTGRAL